MDARLAILLAASALLAGSLVYFVASLLRARRTGHDSVAAIVPPPLDTTARESLYTPLDLGDWTPEGPAPGEAAVGVPATTPSLVPATPSDDLRDDGLVHELDAADAALAAGRAASVVGEASGALQPVVVTAWDLAPLDRAVWEPEPEPLPPPPVAEYKMVAPVELSFADGTHRVGIRPGTATFLKYQRLAAVLLNDLKRSRQG